MTQVKMRQAITQAGNKLIFMSFVGSIVIVSLFYGSVIFNAYHDTKTIVDVQVESELHRIPFNITRMSVGLEDISRAISHSGNIDVSILLERDGRFISGSPIRSSTFVAEASKDFELGGEAVTVKTFLDYSEAIQNALLAIVILSLVLFGMAKAYQIYLKRLVKKMAEPLAELSEQVLAISKSLPESAKSEIKINAEIEEVETLADSANELLKEITSKVNELQKVTKSEAKIEIASMLVHDMRTPLGTLRAGIEFSQHIEPKIKENLLGVVDDLNKLVHELKNIRTTEEDEIEKTKLGVVEVDLDEAIEEYLTKRSVLFEAKKVKADFQPESGYKPVAANPDELQRILSNLVENALAAGSTKLKISTQPIDGMYRLSVADNGSGIEKEKWPKIFEKGVSHRGSSGLGLSFVKERLESWGGHVSVSSVKGQGSTFDLILKESNEESPVIDSIAINPDKALLILDDRKFELDRFRAFFEDKDFNQVFYIQDPSEFFQKVSGMDKNKIQCWVDYNLGVGSPNGIQVIGQLGIQEQSILTTNDYDSRKVIKKCKESKIKLFPKPYLAAEGKVSFQPRLSLATGSNEEVQHG